jgi:hypothetical protein
MNFNQDKSEIEQLAEQLATCLSEMRTKDHVELDRLTATLDAHIACTEAQMSEWLGRFAWSKEVLLLKHGDKSSPTTGLSNSNIDSSAKADKEKEQNATVVCPLVPEQHRRIKLENLEAHASRCRLKELDYDSRDIVSLLLFCLFLFSPFKINKLLLLTKLC